jgi:hypothetical protein
MTTEGEISLRFGKLSTLTSTNHSLNCSDDILKNVKLDERDKDW